MGLLAVVAAAGRKGISRDSVLGILWAESAEESARHTLAQHLYSLRRLAGSEAIVATPELRLGPAVSSDIGDLLDALAAEDDEAVIDLYTGDFLHGFYLQGVPDFERWVEQERARIRAAVLRAHERLASRLDERGGPGASIRVWRRLAELDPLSARYAAGTMRALAALGDGPAAIAHGRAHEELVRRELESEPDPSVRRLLSELRRGGLGAGERDPVPAGRAHGTDGDDRPARTGASPVRTASETLPSSTVEAVPPAQGAPSAAKSGNRPWRLAAVIVVLGVAALGLRSILRGESTSPPLLAVGSVRVTGVTDSTGLSPILRDMLATKLGGIPGLDVIANSRLVELTGAVADTAAAALNDAARRAGAGEIVEGEFGFTESGMTLNLRRVSLIDGVVRDGYIVRAADRFSLIDSAAVAIARDFGLTAPVEDLARIRTTSVQAYALYDEGLRAHYSGESATTLRLMRAALDYDSTFAMAAFYVWQSLRGSISSAEEEEARLRAQRLAPRASERERLLIQGSVSEVDAPFTTTLAIADTLAVRFPNDPDGLMLLGTARFAAGHWAGAIAAFDRVVALDSTARLAADAACRVCSALASVSTAYLWWDSAVAAERTARRLIALRPDNPSGWGALIEPLLRQGRRVEGEEAARQVEIVRRSVASPHFFLHRDLIRAGRYEDVDRELAVAASGASPEASAQARWLWLLALRDQGRLAEALALARDGRIPGTDSRIVGLPPELVHLAVIPLEGGQPDESAARFRGIAASQRASAYPAGTKARHVTWSLTLAGTALATVGDTAGLRALADTVEQTGSGSSFGRDARLHHFLRGLLAQMRGRHADAIPAFERSLFSTTDGYTRINLAMARSLLALGRARDAIAILQPALRGGVDGGNTYVTRTELHEALADAFTAAGMPDSARVHHRAVERALRNADPQFRPRYERARQASANRS